MPQDGAFLELKSQRRNCERTRLFFQTASCIWWVQGYYLGLRMRLDGRWRLPRRWTVKKWI